MDFENHLPRPLRGGVGGGFCSVLHVVLVQVVVEFESFGAFAE
jgi:hypothetical protein